MGLSPENRATISRTDPRFVTGTTFWAEANCNTVNTIMNAARSEATTAQAEALELARARIGELEAQVETVTSILAVYEGSIREVERVYKPNKTRSWVLKILREKIGAALLSPVQTKEGEGA